MSVTDFAAARENMVNSQVRPTDVTDYAIIDAMLDIPRERFVPSSRRFAAYIDEDLDVSGAADDANPRYLIEPSPFAKLVQLAAISPDETVLDIACNTGYSTAVIARLCSSVIGIEEDPGLVGFATEALLDLGVDNAVVVESSLAEGYAKEAPYDAIVIQGAVDRVPEAILDQLRDGGRLVAVVGRGQAGRARLFVKEDGIVSSRPVFNAAIPALESFASNPGFVF